jgi:hypothetical protein
MNNLSDVGKRPAGMLVVAMVWSSLLTLGCVARSSEPTVGTSAAVTLTSAPAKRPRPGRDCQSSDACSWWQEPNPQSQCCSGECTNVEADGENCGSCGNDCGPGLVCIKGKCKSAGVGGVTRAATDTSGVAGAAQCGSMQCGAGQLCCNGRCVLPAVDRSHCGGCAVLCKFEGASCRDGLCCTGDDDTALCRSSTCPNGGVLCGTACTDISADPNNCGGCARVCPGTAKNCVYGTCQP